MSDTDLDHILEYASITACTFSRDAEELIFLCCMLFCLHAPEQVTHKGYETAGVQLDGVGNHPNAWTAASLQFYKNKEGPKNETPAQQQQQQQQQQNGTGSGDAQVTCVLRMML